MGPTLNNWDSSRHGAKTVEKDKSQIGSSRGMRDLKIYLILNKQSSFLTATVRLYHLCGLLIEQSGC
ncbi:hypothetical protein AAG906_019433 [Vitis piasezkii]